METAEEFTTGWKPVKKIPIKVPIETLLVCREISKEIKTEFAILLKCKDFNCSSDYVIPEQQVTYSSVDFDNVKLLEYRKQGYNAVIHYHPMDLKKFSGTDDEYINSHFDISILFCGGEFTDAIVNLDINNMRVQLEAEIELVTPNINIDKQELETKIKPKTYNTITKLGGGLIDKETVIGKETVDDTFPYDVYRLDRWRW